MRSRVTRAKRRWDVGACVSRRKLGCQIVSDEPPPENPPPSPKLPPSLLSPDEPPESPPLLASPLPAEELASVIDRNIRRRRPSSSSVWSVRVKTIRRGLDPRRL